MVTIPLKLLYFINVHLCRVALTTRGSVRSSEEMETSWPAPNRDNETINLYLTLEIDKAFVPDRLNAKSFTVLYR